MIPGTKNARQVRWVAAIDAVAWPLFGVLLFSQIDAPVGIVGPLVVAIALLISAERIHRALWVNHRYWFTTWRWAVSPSRCS